LAQLCRASKISQYMEKLIGKKDIDPMATGRLQGRDNRISQLLALAPWLVLIGSTLPFPLLFLVLFLASTATDTAAVYLLLSFVSLGVGLVVGLILVLLLLFYRRHWHKTLRDRLAADGITAGEVVWFESELSSEERKAWRELKNANPLLADAYCETLAARLTATRIATKARGEILRIERQLNRTRSLRRADTAPLVNDLIADRHRVELLRKEAHNRVGASKARLQTIEAAAHRALSQSETELMLRRLVSSQEHFPLALEMARMEQEAIMELKETAHDQLPPDAGGK
jgi:hypothetical protein